VTRFGHAPVALRRAIASRERIVIRRACDADADALRRLLDLADRDALDPGPALLAEADGTLVAAISVATGTLVRDPFVASDDVAALLRLRAAQLDRAA
jgi:hypothetical protein